MKIIGLTGPSGSGKGICCEYLRSIGIPCIDTDQVYHDLLLPPSACAKELVARFGQDIIKEDQTVNRQKLAAIVFSDASGKSVEALNRISHTHIREKTLALLDQFQKQKIEAVVVDAPLLFEADFDKFCDFSIAVLADRGRRLERIIARDGLSLEKANARLSAQKNDTFYISKADYVLYNNGGCEDLYASLAATLKKENISSDT